MTVFLRSNFNGEGWLEPPLSYPVQTIYDAAGSVFLDSLGCVPSAVSIVIGGRGQTVAALDFWLSGSSNAEGPSLRPM